MNEQQLNLLKEEIKKDEEIVKKDEALQRLKDIMAVYNGEDRVVSSKELQEEIKSRPEELKILSGIEGLDKILDGFRLKQLITLSAATKSGKTSFAVDLTLKLKDYNPLWFPFEEGAEELIQKFLDRGEDAPLFYTPRTMKQNQLKWLEDKIVESIAKYGTRVVFIDHLHFIVPFTTNRQDLAIGNVMRLLKQITTKWNIVIFLMAHLKKVKSDTQPSIDDLRDASWIGQESDTVMIIWRQTKRNRDGEVVITNNTNISVQANRRTGKTGNVKMVFLDGKFFEQEWADEKNDY